MFFLDCMARKAEKEGREMAKKREVYICGECGYETPKWLGRCPSCGTWNSFTAVSPLGGESSALSRSRAQAAKPAPVSPITADAGADEIRYRTGMPELDRVLGGGLVKGSVLLIGGEPGIGKSTLLLQICQKLGEDEKVLYVSGEESAAQLQMRARRLHVDAGGLFVLASGDLDTVLATISAERPKAVVIDSIQTMMLSAVGSSAGSVAQVRECAAALTAAAKESGIPVILVGHVTKEGSIAGPRTLEHMVDAVIQFEGEQNHAYRMLRAVKNRYGATNELAVFEMKETGLKEVPNPSAMLLSERPEGVSGSCVVCVLEGSRPILAEVQALVTKSALASPRRMSTGFDHNRMSLLLAVLEKRAGYTFSALDAYVNVVGGLWLDEPASDLPIALALTSALRDRPIPQGMLAIGEVGLAGEVRSVIRLEDRVREAERLGFTHCLVPASSLKGMDTSRYSIRITGVKDVVSALRAVAAAEKSAGAPER